MQPHVGPCFAQDWSLSSSSRAIQPQRWQSGVGQPQTTSLDCRQRTWFWRVCEPLPSGALMGLRHCSQPRASLDASKIGEYRMKQRTDEETNKKKLRHLTVCLRQHCCLEPWASWPARLRSIAIFKRYGVFGGSKDGNRVKQKNRAFNRLQYWCAMKLCSGICATKLG